MITQKTTPTPSPVKLHSLTLITRLTCRVCLSDALLPVLSLGEHCISDFVDDAQETHSVPLELVLCDSSQGGCGLLQLKHTADQNLLYRNYWYRSGVNETMRRALADVATRAEQLARLTHGDMVIDIGSNDNTLLNSYTVDGLEKIGFEPATNLMPYAQDSDLKVINDYFTAAQFTEALPGRLAKVITSIAMFYDLEDPNMFVADAKTCLAPDGIWIIQMAYLPIMLKDNIFDNICHEHLEYYLLISLIALLKRHQLKVIDVELNDVNGGSLRAYITHDVAKVAPFPGAAKRVADMITEEKNLKLDTPEPYYEFAARVEKIKQKLTAFVRKEVGEGKTVYVYGASTKGNTLLQYFDLDHSLITAAAERNSDKWGKKTVATNIPIISEEEARSANPDYFLVLPWHFLSEFIERERAFLTRGGKFIAPLPKFRLIDRSALQANAPGQSG